MALNKHLATNFVPKMCNLKIYNAPPWIENAPLGEAKGGHWPHLEAKGVK